VTSHAITLHVQVSASDYRDATRLLNAGNRNANPITLALLGMSAYALIGCTADRITLLQVTSSRRYSGSVPIELAKYLADFQRGVRTTTDHAFELVLERESN
jgi:hypothetical protein